MDRVSGHCGGGDGGEPEGDDQEDSSSSSIKSEPVCALDEFRNEWKKELERSPSHLITGNNQRSDPIPHNIEDKAKIYFQMGIENENNGKLYEAIQCYRRAVQLVPDIELRMFQHSTPHSEVTSENEEVAEESEEDGENLEKDEEVPYKPGTDLLSHLSYISYKQEKIPLCTPHHATNITHISALPMEIFLYILRWVVSTDLDLRALELCARACRGFYICARDQEIWRIACTRIWGLKCGGVGGRYLSWREMYIYRPRLCFEGCYISKTTYFRHGENSFQDQFYRPWHLVEYFRYLRFFPDGRVLSLTTPEEPVSSVGLLKGRTPQPRHPPVFVGYYRLVDSTVSVFLMAGPDKAKSRSNSNNPTHTFHLELEIATQKKRLHSQLVWRGYSVFTRRNGVETNTPFDLPSARYPPFWFSRVKSYSGETTHPLCK